MSVWSAAVELFGILVAYLYILSRPSGNLVPDLSILVANLYLLSSNPYLLSKSIVN